VSSLETDSDPEKTPTVKHKTSETLVSSKHEKTNKYDLIVEVQEGLIEDKMMRLRENLFQTIQKMQENQTKVVKYHWKLKKQLLEVEMEAAALDRAMSKSRIV